MGQVAKLFMNGRSQAVRLPAKYRFEGTEVEVRDGPKPGEVIISPRKAEAQKWEEMFAAIEALNIPEAEWDDFNDLRDKSPPRPSPFGDG